MKTKTISLLVIISIFCLLATAFGESVPASVTAGEEWSWDPGTKNVFDGEIDLSEYSGQEMTICMKSDLPYQSEDELAGSPVFTVVNGKRITMLKQCDTARCTPTEEDPVMHFSARFTMPAENRVYRIVFQFTVTDASGKEVSKYNTEISAGKAGAAGPFYIPADIRMITVIIFIAAAAIWAAAVLIHCGCRKRKRTGE